jgi:hypothetical protein
MTSMENEECLKTTNKPNQGEIMVKFQNIQNAVLVLCPGYTKGKGGTDTENGGKFHHTRIHPC